MTAISTPSDQVGTRSTASQTFMLSHPFTLRDGRAYQLTKHPRLAHASAEAQAAAPWGIRLVDPATGKRGWQSLRIADTAKAVKAAKEMLLVHGKGKEAWITWSEINHRRAGQVCRGIIDDYLAAGCPRRKGREWFPRTGRSLDDERSFLAIARAWWADKPVSTIGEAAFEAYATHRLHAPRSCEIELNALSNAFKWAIKCGKAQTNPMIGRGPVRNPDKITHCYSEMPASAEELHAICRWLMADPRLAPYGAHLMYMALTGQRAGEPGALLRHPKPGEFGDIETRTVVGSTFRQIHVLRLKGGINPAVRIHDALGQFLAAWIPYRDERWPTNPYLIPHPHQPNAPAVPAGDSSDSYLDKAMKRAAAAVLVGTRSTASPTSSPVPNRRPHALRAYCGAVHLAAGSLPSEVASILGEKSGEKMIVEAYGNPRDIVGDGRYTWLPKTGEPCWTVLAAASQPANVIPMTQLGTKLDTLGCTQTTPSHPTATESPAAIGASSV